MNPIAAIVVTLVLLLLFIGGLAYGSARLRGRRKGRRKAFADAAAARGWAYEARASGLTNAFSVKPFRRGATRRPEALDVVSAVLNGRRAVGFRYRYVRGTNPDNLSNVYSSFTVCAVQLPPGSNIAAPGRVSFAVDRGNEMVRRVMLARRRVNWCVDGNWLMCWERGVRASPDDVFDRLGLLSEIIDGRAGHLQLT